MGGKYAKVAMIYSKNGSSNHEIVKKEKEICANCAVLPRSANIMASVDDKGLVKMEKQNISHLVTISVVRLTVAVSQCLYSK